MIDGIRVSPAGLRMAHGCLCTGDTFVCSQPEDGKPKPGPLGALLAETEGETSLLWNLNFGMLKGASA